MQDDHDPTVHAPGGPHDGEHATTPTFDDDGTPESRYAVRGTLGRGGMGEVRLSEDRRAGREVAFKVARSEIDHQGVLRSRFLHEARIQAQLEHPSIVPVYDIGLGRDGTPFFTMKRVHGVTLRQVLRKLSSGDEEACARYTQRRLLTAFATVCMTVHFAHTREVLHRDLKPTNIMFGEYAEIYVLDWGVARVEGTPEPTPMTLRLSPRAEETTPGEIVGTPGYISPEQLRGGEVDARSDVYALGVMLYEILTLEPLHGFDRVKAMHSTLFPEDARPSARAPERGIPPELDAICEKATALSPKDRYRTAREIHDAVDRYLEGDRDLTRRRELSAVHTVTARAHSVRALEAEDPAVEAAARRSAMGEVNTALALDPDNQAARRVLMDLLTSPPRVIPAEAKAEMERGWSDQARRAARAGVIIYLCWFLFVPLYVLFGYSTRGFVCQAVAFGAAVVALFRASRPSFEHTKRGPATILLTSLAISSIAALAGPFFIVPCLAIANGVAFSLQPDRSRRALILVATCLTVVLPLLLDALGVVPPAYVFEHGAMIVENRTMDFSRGFTLVSFMASTVLSMLMICVYFMRTRDMLTAAEEKLHVHAWQLRQLVAADASALAAVSTPE